MPGLIGLRFRTTAMTKEELITFEKEVARRYEAGEIHAPVHLSGGNEDQLIEIFKDIKRTDWILSTWRSHLHAILHGISPDELMRQILAGKSMSVNSVDPPFYASAIAGGILPIAVGLGMGIRRRNGCRHCGHTWEEHNTTADYERECRACGDCYDFEHDDRKVFCFVGDMTAATGGFEEATKYAWNFQLPVTFVVEDNGKSVATDTRMAWRTTTEQWRSPIDSRPNVLWYRYELSWPHHGSGKWVSF